MFPILIGEVVLNDFWFSIIGSLSMIIVTLIGTYLLLLRNYVTRTEVQSMIIDNQINRTDISEMIELKTKLLDIELKHIQSHNAKLEIMLDKLSEKLDELNLKIAKI